MKVEIDHQTVRGRIDISEYICLEDPQAWMDQCAERCCRGWVSGSGTVEMENVGGPGFDLLYSVRKIRWTFAANEHRNSFRLELRLPQPAASVGEYR